MSASLCKSTVYDSFMSINRPAKGIIVEKLANEEACIIAESPNLCNFCDTITKKNLKNTCEHNIHTMKFPIVIKKLKVTDFLPCNLDFSDCDRILIFYKIRV